MNPSTASAGISNLLWKLVLTIPGLKALTRILGANSAAKERAKERTAALVAKYKLAIGAPFSLTAEAFKIMLEFSFNSPTSFCTVKKTPLTLISN